MGSVAGGRIVTVTKVTKVATRATTTATKLPTVTLQDAGGDGRKRRRRKRSVIERYAVMSPSSSYGAGRLEGYPSANL